MSWLYYADLLVCIALIRCLYYADLLVCIIRPEHGPGPGPLDLLIGLGQGPGPRAVDWRHFQNLTFFEIWTSSK